MGKTTQFNFFIYIIFALYLINSAFGFIQLPEAVLNFEKWIFVIIAALLIWGGYRSRKVRMMKTGEDMI